MTRNQVDRAHRSDFSRTMQGVVGQATPSQLSLGLHVGHRIGRTLRMVVEDRDAVADTGDKVIAPVVPGDGEADIARSDRRDATLIGEAQEPTETAVIALAALVGEFKEEAIVKYLAQRSRQFTGQRVHASVDDRVEEPLVRPRQADYVGTVGSEVFECRPRVISVVPFTGGEVGIRDEPAQVGVPLARASQQDKVPGKDMVGAALVTLALWRPADGHFGPEHVTNAVLLAGLLEPDDAVRAVAVRDTHDGHTEPGGFGNEGFGR